ncbi:HNH endonuclease signature motif containing protein [Phycicoccus sonneratiae]|uniref:HNH endonuclease n=1 Tax=Phycicoccus sonneratiae TaxID=2807628 RepID=A0ABS2CPS9_9MICO|nr:HNH endonuclease signature motif containing protein [Phycicoccus sonneraticus]MBM6401898.1 HNH endonuclease [Phycicoccus sonneraticus]
MAARFCDLDHVVPWPAGPTSAANLACLCRRHHRVKQRPGWRAALAPEGTMTWTDPTGRVRTTTPLDALGATVLPDIGSDRAPTPRAISPRDGRGPFSRLEFHLEHALGDADPPLRRCRFDHHRPLDPVLVHGPAHRRRERPPPRPDLPPF